MVSVVSVFGRSAEQHWKLVTFKRSIRKEEFIAILRTKFFFACFFIIFLSSRTSLLKIQFLLSKVFFFNLITSYPQKLHIVRAIRVLYEFRCASGKVVRTLYCYRIVTEILHLSLFKFHHLHLSHIIFLNILWFFKGKHVIVDFSKIAQTCVKWQVPVDRKQRHIEIPF